MACAGLLMLAAAGGRAARFTVTKAADTLDGSCDADCSLREAVQAANTDATADEIVLPGLRLRRRCRAHRRGSAGLRGSVARCAAAPPGSRARRAP